MSSSSPREARQFLANKIIAQAARAGLKLSEADHRLLLLNLNDPQSAAGIPLAVLEDAGRSYEKRNIQLLKSAYERDRNYPEERQRYREALRGLMGSNHYMLMIASAALSYEKKISNFAIYFIIALAVVGIALLLFLWVQPK